MTSIESNTTLPKALALLAAHWVALQVDPTMPPQEAATLTRAWRQRGLTELALLPEAQRAFVCATQELVLLLAQFAEGRQALADLGFEPLFEDVEHP